MAAGRKRLTWRIAPGRIYIKNISDCQKSSARRARFGRAG
jgi:hypothetical protein